MSQPTDQGFRALPLWSKIVGVLALVATAGMIVWAILDAVRGAGFSEVAIDIFIAAALLGTALTVLRIWKRRDV